MRRPWLPLLALPGLAALFWFFWYVPYPDTPGPASEATTVVIPRGAGLRRIQSILVRAGVVPDDPRFMLLARISGLGRHLRAGEYDLAPRLSPRQILDILASGRVKQYRLTIPEGLTIDQVAAILAREGGIDRQGFIALSKDPALIRSLGLSVKTLEGYLFPDTYVLTREQLSARVLITLMIHRFHEVWTDLAPAPPSSLTQHQVVVLASMVEKETAAPAERPLIAGVFLNRLARGMRLQSDPTVIYGLGPSFTGPLTRADLKIPSPTNTYLIAGLPPTPICNPGRAALAAARHPAVTDALYFVARGDGTHVFSRTLREHNRAVRRFRR